MSSGDTNRRGVRINKEEKETIDRLVTEGSNVSQIAQEIGRNRKTVAKYLKVLGGRRLEVEVRKQVMASALREHFRDLARQAGMLKERFNPVGPWNVSTLDLPMPVVDLPAEPLLALPIDGPPLFVFNTWRRMYGEDSQAELLADLLKQHTQGSQFWKLRAQWEEITGGYARAGKELGEELRRGIHDLQAQYQQLTVKAEFAGTLMGHILLLADGNPGVNPSEMTIGPTGEDGRLGLSCKGVVVATAKTAAELKPAHELLIRIAEECVRTQVWSTLVQGCQHVRRKQARLAGLHGEILDELEILSLRKSFPGTCRLCSF